MIKCLLCVLVVLYLYMSESEYQHELDMGKYYVKMVCDGSWPNYKQLNIKCGE